LRLLVAAIKQELDLAPALLDDDGRPDVGIPDVAAIPSEGVEDGVRLGLERRAVDAIFRALPVVCLPGYSRPLIRVRDYLELVESSTYRRDRVPA
jgi:hypothetical protein